MKKLLITVLFLIFAALQSFAQTKIKVVEVFDGDTILAKINDNTFKIRLIGIDCFERSIGQRAQTQARKNNLTQHEIVEGGILAGEILKNELSKKEVYFEFQGIDKYKRALGILYVDNININEKMLQTPYCSVYKKR